MKGEKEEDVKVLDNEILTLKEIAKNIIDKDKAMILKQKAYEGMGIGYLFEEQSLVLRQTEEYAKVVTKKSTLLDYLKFCRKKFCESSERMRGVLRRFYEKEQNITPEIRLRVK